MAAIAKPVSRLVIPPAPRAPAITESRGLPALVSEVKMYQQAVERWTRDVEQILKAYSEAITEIQTIVKTL